VHGYELLHRSSEQNRFSGNGETATQSVLDNTLLFGLATLVGEGLAFVNCTRETLVRRLVTLMPPERTVLEILETVEPDDEVIEACRTLAGRGYRLALDDFVLAPGCERLLELADYVKIDFLASDAR
jgi:EAL and modified HD-GYP domain-containing signal transduction protein